MDQRAVSQAEMGRVLQIEADRAQQADSVSREEQISDQVEEEGQPGS